MTTDAKRCRRCGKKVYPTQTAAFGAALRNSAKFAHPMRAYPCPYGLGFHLTKRHHWTERSCAA